MEKGWDGKWYSTELERIRRRHQEYSEKALAEKNLNVYSEYGKRRSILCILGIHNYKWLFEKSDEDYQVCVRPNCKKVRISNVWHGDYC